MNTKQFKTLEIIGAPVIYLIATLLHFVYDLSHGSTLSILFGAVNESVWEHVKIFAVGFVLWSVIELLWGKPQFMKFIVAKTFCLYLLSVLIIVFFYIYTFFTGEHIVVVDLVSSAFFVVLTQYISYRLIMSDKELSHYFVLACMLLMLFFIMFFSFTVFPPQADLFKDPVTGMYGIIGDHVDTGAVFLDKTS